MKHLLLGAIVFYQKTVARVLPPGTCRFYPSCSEYAYTVVARHGALKGGWLAFGRLARCHPFHPGGLDPAP